DTVPVFSDEQLLGYSATISPDGNWVAFLSPVSQGIQLYNFDDASGTIIRNQMGMAAQWSPDSAEIAVSDVVFTDEIWNTLISGVNARTAEATVLSQPGPEDEGLEDANPVFSPDGQRLAFTRKQAGAVTGRQIWTMNRDGTNAQPLTTEDGVHHGLLAYSPDGQALVYQRFNLKDLNSQTGVWVLDLRTGETHEIAPEAAQPAWLP
ncbi:MAG: hypothetical protein R3C44_21815, partial [Chloroflexota bacterium]